MIEEIKNIKNEKSDFRKFGITVGLFLVVIAGFLFWKGKASFEIMLVAGLVLFVLGLTIPIVLKPVYWVWMAIGAVLGWIMTRVILGVLFYLVITPIGTLSRLSRNKFLDLKWQEAKDSYWNARNVEQRKNEDYEGQF